METRNLAIVLMAGWLITIGLSFYLGWTQREIKEVETIVEVPVEVPVYKTITDTVYAKPDDVVRVIVKTDTLIKNDTVYVDNTWMDRSDYTWIWPDPEKEQIRLYIQAFGLSPVEQFKLFPRINLDAIYDYNFAADHRRALASMKKISYKEGEKVGKRRGLILGSIAGGLAAYAIWGR